ncbi:MAG TPA: hypothetical protein VFK40_08420 [Nitrososphaeraceae archaeon]|nr:hypothetical protein [Nitrososphaeraceae archaeon]
MNLEFLKPLNKHNMKFDLLAGSSIRVVNASIICSAQNDNKNAAAILENFRLNIAENIFYLPLILSLLLHFMIK